jgi:hypothetical protein
MRPISVGSDPVKWFPDTPKTARVVRRDNSVGKVPMSLLKEMLRVPKFCKRPSSVGIAPSNRDWADVDFKLKQMRNSAARRRQINGNKKHKNNIRTKCNL